MPVEGHQVAGSRASMSSETSRALGQSHATVYPLLTNAPNAIRFTAVAIHQDRPTDQQSAVMSVQAVPLQF